MSAGGEETALRPDLWLRNLSAKPILLISFTQELLLRDSERSGNSLFVSCYKYLSIICCHEHLAPGPGTIW